MAELWQLDARAVVDLLRSNSVSIQEALHAVEQRIEQTDQRVNALPTRCFDRASKHADHLQKLPPEQRGLLAGLPVPVKDLTDVSGVRTTYGSTIYKDHVPPHSDRLVQRLEQRGAVIYAKSNTPEFGTGGTTFNDVFGITRNPRNTAFNAGGSSGGAAAALACGSAWLAHGSDMAGSLRTPAAFCGVTSLRPSAGLISADAQYTPYCMLAQEGPMARSVRDLALFADAMLDAGSNAMTTAIGSPRAPQRIAVSFDLGITSISEEIRSAVESFATLLAGSGVEVQMAEPDLSGVHEAFDILRAHSYAVNMEQLLMEHPATMKPEVEWNINQGLQLSASDVRRGLRLQGESVNHTESFMQDFDLLICPATSISGVAAELRYPGADQSVPIAEYYRWLAIAYAFTVTGQPVVTLPIGLTGEGLPVAVQLVGKPRQEPALLQYALWLEQLAVQDKKPVDPAA